MSKTRPGITKDLYCLLKAFEARNDLSYDAFTSCWRDLKMTMIHYGEKQPEARRLLVEEFFEHVISVLHTLRQRHVYIWAVYTLFSLHQTQLLAPRIPILIDSATWNLLLDFLRNLPSSRYERDVKKIFSAMVKERCFLFGMSDPAVKRYPIAVIETSAATVESSRARKPVDIRQIPNTLWDKVHEADLIQGLRNYSVTLDGVQQLYDEYEDAMVEVDVDGEVAELNMYNQNLPKELYSNLQRYWRAFDERVNLVWARVKEEIDDSRQYRNRIYRRQPVESGCTSDASKRRGRLSAVERLEQYEEKEQKRKAIEGLVQSEEASVISTPAFMATSDSVDQFHMPVISAAPSRPHSRLSQSSSWPKSQQSASSKETVTIVGNAFASSEPPRLADEVIKSGDKIPSLLSEIFSDTDDDDV
eukprot:CFRG1124T1